MLELRAEVAGLVERGAPRGRPEGPLRSLCRREQEQVHSAYLVAGASSVSVSAPEGRGGVWVQPRHGDHHPLRRGRV